MGVGEIGSIAPVERDRPLLGHVLHRYRLRPVHSYLAHNFANEHHLHHLARTVLVVGANVAAFGILWLLKFIILNRLFTQIADAEVGAATE